MASHAALSTPVTKGAFALPTNLYDVAKDTALIYLPALGALYFAMAGIWGLPYADQFVATVVAFDTFLGVILKISTVSYNNSDKSKDGTLVVDQSDLLKDKYLLDITTPLEEVADAKTITLRVDNLTTNGASQ